MNEIIPESSNTIEVLQRAEIDQAIATARKFPRSVKRFRDEAMQMVCLTEDVAADCIYALPRDGKTIEGPSARFAEVIASAWGNSRAGARVIAEDKEFIVAQGVFHDLERNVQINFEVKRRITTKSGKRYNADMIATTGNAACSIALRNAILKGVPKAFWSEMYEAARKTAVGDQKTLSTRRAEALAYLQKQGVTQDMVFAALGVAGIDDIGLDELATLRGLATAIKEGDLTIEEAFKPKAAEGEVTMPKAKAPSDTPPAEASQTPPPPPAGTESPIPKADPEDVGDQPIVCITQGQVDMLTKRAKAKGISVDAVCGQFGIAALEELAASRFNDARNWIDGQQK